MGVILQTYRHQREPDWICVGSRGSPAYVCGVENECVCFHMGTMCQVPQNLRPMGNGKAFPYHSDVNVNSVCRK